MPIEAAHGEHMGKRGFPFLRESALGAILSSVSRNETLFELRMKAGLTRKEAARSLKMPAFLLKRYEEGYSLINGKRAAQFAEFYGVDASIFLEDRLNYPTPIATTPEATPKKESDGKLMRKVSDVFSSPKLLIPLISLFCLDLAGVIVSGIFQAKTFNEPEAYYSEAVRAVQGEVAEKGEPADTSIFWAILGASLNEVTIEDDGENSFSILTAVGDDFYGVTIFHCQRPYGEEEGAIEETSITITPGGEVGVAYDNPNINDIFGALSFGTYANGVLSFPEDIPEQILTPESQQEARALFGVGLEKANDYLSNVEEGLDFDGYLAQAHEGNRKQLHERNISYNFCFVLSLLGILMLGALIYGIYAFLVKKQRIKSLEAIEMEDDLIEAPPKKKEAPRNLPSFLFLKEGYAKVIFLATLIVGSLSILINFIHLMNPEASFFSAFDYESYMEVAKVFLYLSLFAIFLIKLDAIINRKSVLFSLFSSLLLGLLFYVVEVFIALYAVNLASFRELISSFLPSNLFFGMTALLSLAYFLLYTPPSLDRTYKKVLFRLLSLIPVAYLVAGFVMTYLDEEMAIDLSPYLTLLFQTKSVETVLFSFLSILFVALMRLILGSIYGEEGITLVLKGNLMQTCKNAFLCLLLLALTLTAWLYEPDGGFWGEIFSLESDRYLFCLIPFLLLYRPRIPKSDSREDLAFILTYDVLYLGPYAAVGLIILFI